MRVIFHIVGLLALAMIVGSIAFFGFGVAGVVFDSSILSSRTIAGTLNGTIIGRLNLVTSICSVIAVGMFIPLAVKDRTPLLWGSLFLALGAAIIAVYLSTTLFPEIEGLRRSIGDFDRMLADKEANREAFESIHTRYSLLVRLEWLAAVVALLCHAGRLGWALERGRRQASRRRPDKATSKTEHPLSTTAIETPIAPVTGQTTDRATKPPKERASEPSSEPPKERASETAVEPASEPAKERASETVTEQLTEPDDIPPYVETKRKN